MCTPSTLTNTTVSVPPTPVRRVVVVVVLCVVCQELQRVQLRIAALTSKIEKLAPYDTRAWCSRLKMYCDDSYDEYLRHNRMSRVQDGRWRLFKYFSYVSKVTKGDS